MTTWKDVVTLYQRKPWLTNAEAAEILDCHVEYVRATCRRRGIKFQSVARTKLWKKAWDDLRWVLEQSNGGHVHLTLDEDRCVVMEAAHGDGGGKVYRAWRPEDAIIAIAERIRAGN